jgi:hypothetical protein
MIEQIPFLYFIFFFFLLKTTIEDDQMDACPQ